MKKLLALGITAALLAGIGAHATTVTITALSGYSTGAPNDGGEYNINPVIGSGYAPSVIVNGGFETFCMDRNGSIVVPGTYNATINTTGTALTGNTLTTGAAWLYQQFALGVLAGYNYTDTTHGVASLRAQSAYSLQLALWNLGNGQYGGAAGTYNDPLHFVALAVANFGSVAAATSFTTGAPFDIGILNMTTMNTRSGGNAQPMFTLLPDGGTTLMLLGFGFSSLALVSRKLRA